MNQLLEKLMLALIPCVALAFGGNALAHQVQQPPPTSTSWSVTSTKTTDTVVPKAAGNETWRVRNNAEGGTVRVRRKDKDGNTVGDPQELDAGDSTDIELAKDDKLQVEYISSSASGTASKV